MTHAEHIANRFSDAYLVALMTSGNTENALHTFSAEYPELTERFAQSAHDLELMYGYMRQAEKPTLMEISSAYAKVSARMPEQIVRKGVESSKEQVSASSFAAFLNIFKMKPVLGGASLGLGLAVVLALIWQPWTTNYETVAEQNNGQVQTAPGSNDYAVNIPQTVDNTNPTQIQPPTFRGPKKGLTMPTKEQRRQDSLDAIRIKALANKTALSAPSNLKIEALTPGSVMVRWAATTNAIGYIIEMKRANEDKFSTVSQTTQTRFQLRDLRSGETIQIRIVPTSGERKGTASDAKSIVVP